MARLHPDLTNVSLLYAVRDEALLLSGQSETDDTRIAYRLLATTAGYLGALLERDSLGRKLEASSVEVTRLNQLVTDLRIELGNCMDATRDKK